MEKEHWCQVKSVLFYTVVSILSSKYLNKTERNTQEKNNRICVALSRFNQAFN